MTAHTLNDADTFTALLALKAAEEQICVAALYRAAKLADSPLRNNLRVTANYSRLRIDLIEGILAKASQ